MSKIVTNPPALIPQQTSAWCFAAAEAMARQFYNINPTKTQYQIARDSLMRLVDAMDPSVFAQWNNATINDLQNNQEENGGNNLFSERVNLIRNSYGAVDYSAINGSMKASFSEDNFRFAIDNNNIVIIGNSIHYYVVYGYDDTVEFTLLVLDPWPQNKGGLRTTIPFSEVSGWSNRVFITFNS